MRGAVGSPPGSLEARHRTSATFDDTSKKRLPKSKELGKLFTSQERTISCKISSLKFILFLIICGTFLTIFHSPADHRNEHSQFFSSRFVDVSLLWERITPDSRYVSHSDVDWPEVVKSIGNMDVKKEEKLKIALLNFNDSEVSNWQQLLPLEETSVIHLDHASHDITWDALYPEWIDEEEESEIPSCPHLPDPNVPKGSQFDLVVVKLPCNRSENWSRDVARLHLQLAAAKLAVKGRTEAYVLFFTECFPIPNLFSCKNLVSREGNQWLYKPDVRMLKQKLKLPVGSCELALPLIAEVRPLSLKQYREAYATILHSAQVYLCGAIAAAQSIRLTGSKRDLVVLVDETFTAHDKLGLEAAGWQVRTIQRIRNPKAERDAYNEWNYSKFRLWQLTDYDKIIFIDADLLILRNIDFLFTMPEISATGNNGTLFNSGVMVIEPSNCTFELLMEHINEIVSYNGGDQGYLNEIFTWWHRIPRHMNFLKHFWYGDDEVVKKKKIQYFSADPPILYVLHYLGLKPWLCFRDYDCNWNIDFMQEFASDDAHRRWWRVHDTMPKELQQYCLLRSKQKAALEWDRRQAEKGNYSDGHWQRKIQDRRLKVCVEEFCYWESMLWHWGEAN